MDDSDIFGKPAKQANPDADIFNVSPRQPITVSAPVDNSTDLNVPRITMAEKVVKGMNDPLEGGAQLLYNILPPAIRSAGDRFNNWLAEKTGLVAPIPEGGFNSLVANNEKAYQDARTQAGESGIDGWRAAGNVVSPPNILVASAATKVAPLVSRFAGKLAGNVAAGATGGAMQGAISPVDDANYWDEKQKQAEVGAATGAALPVFGKLFPKNTAAASDLKAAGVDVPIGQSIGGFAKSFEDKATSIPLLGDAINLNRRKAIEQFNIATLDKALEPLGVSLPKGTAAGRDALDKALTLNSDAYNAILPNIVVKADNQFVNDMAQLKQLAQNLPQSEMDQFNRIIANEVDGKFTQFGLMSGETFKQAESKLGQLARGYAKAEGYEKQQLADALYQAQANLRSAVERNNPQFADRIQDINKSYAALMRPERAASYVGAQDGVFTPAHLLSAVKATDPSLRHRAFSRGNALMQDWAEGAKGTLSSNVPDSGTAGRLMLGGGALGGIGLLNIPAALGGALATAAYLPGGRQLASGLLNTSQGVANTISNRAAYATPLFAPLAYGLLNKAP